MRTKSVYRENAFSSRLLTWPAERIQNTCCILWRKNYRLAICPGTALEKTSRPPAMQPIEQMRLDELLLDGKEGRGMA